MFYRRPNTCYICRTVRRDSDRRQNHCSKDHRAIRKLESRLQNMVWQVSMTHRTTCNIGTLKFELLPAPQTQWEALDTMHISCKVASLLRNQALQVFAPFSSDLNAYMYAACLWLTFACLGHYGSVSSMCTDCTSAALQTCSHWGDAILQCSSMLECSLLGITHGSLSCAKACWSCL